MHFNTKSLHKPFLYNKVSDDVDDGFLAFILGTHILATEAFSKSFDL